jgi:hypothetical protein
VVEVVSDDFREEVAVIVNLPAGEFVIVGVVE